MLLGIADDLLGHGRREDIVRLIVDRDMSHRVVPRRFVTMARRMTWPLRFCLKYCLIRAWQFPGQAQSAFYGNALPLRQSSGESTP
jgi:hypothetical protein